MLHLLDVVHHAVAAREGFLQLVIYHGHEITACLRFDVEVIDSAEAQLNILKGVTVLDQPLNVGLGRSATVIAQAIEHHGVSEIGVRCFNGQVNLSVEIVTAGHVCRRDTKANHLRAAAAPPAESLCG